MLEFITDAGKKLLELVSEYHLEEYIDIQAGNIIISDKQMNNEIMNNCMAYIRNNPEWIMGYEKTEEDAFWYIIEKASVEW